MARVMEIVTPLGADVLLFHRMKAREEMGRLFEYDLDLLSNKGDINLDDILAKNVTVKLELPEGKTRHFNGYVTRFAQVGMHGRYHLYRATVRPWLWFLTRVQNSRIFQDMTVPEIIKQVFDEHSIAAVKQDGLSGSYPKRVYCVQYRETDFNFVSRLMEDEGIYYYFKHEQDKHTLMLSDSYSAHEKFEGYAKIPFVPLERTARIEQEYIHEWTLAREVEPGKFVLNDFDFEKPSTSLLVRTHFQRKYDLSDYEIYDHPGGYMLRKDGDQYVRTRMEEAQYQFELASAKCNARGLCVGYLFELTGQSRTDQNREYLVLSADYELEYTEYEAMENQGAKYACGFSVLNSKQAFRPQCTTRKPFVQGPQTAIVVGPSGDEIYTDNYGRVKVQFHWDRNPDGKKDEELSCWMRVSHPWAGKGWGAVSIPRIGQEVIVDFLEGDPDRPIITGRVYNKESMPPYGLPDGAVVSGIKSNTHKGSGYNEMSMDDTAGKEKISIHGQYDMNTTVEHDKASEIKNNRSAHIVVDDTLNVDANRTVHIKGKHSETVDAGQEVTVAAGYTETITGGATSTISGGLTSTVNGTWGSTVNGHLAETVTAGEEITVTGGLSETVTGERSMTVTGPISQSATATMDLHATAAGTYSSDASLTLTVGGSGVEITPAAITISSGGSTIKVDASGVSVNGAKISLNG